MSQMILSSSQDNLASPRDISTPPAANPFSTSNPSRNSRGSSDTFMATGSPPLVAVPAPAPAPAMVFCPTPEPVLAHNSPATQTNSKETPGAQNDISAAQTTTVPSDDPRVHIIKPFALTVHPEPAAGSSTSALGSVGNSDKKGDSQPVQSTPSTLGTSKRTRRPKKAPKAKKITTR